MSYRDKFRRHIGINTALAQHLASAEFDFADTTRRLTRRTTKITDRCEIEVIEQKAGLESATLFTIPPTPGETTKLWTSERTAEIEEIFE
jgi:hypothetical protein